jgi:beta-glucosidase
MRFRIRACTALIGAGAIAVSLLPALPASAATPQTATVSADQSVYLVDEGSGADVAIAITTSDGKALTQPVTVAYTTATGSATPGADYASASGSLTFAGGTTSGSTQRLRVATRTDSAAEAAESIPVRLSATNGATIARQPNVVINAHGLPYLDRRQPVDRRVADLMRRMTLEEKVGQMTQAERGAVAADPTLIAQWQLGSVLSGGGSTPATNTPAAWVEMVNAFQRQALSTRLQIPMIYGIDAVHGHGNVYGATIFPHNVGLGSSRDARLAERVGKATAEEVRATGIPWNFAPCICVSRDERWGRAYESFGEDPSLVIRMESVIDGFQGRIGDPERVLSTAKHYAGDGDTEYNQAQADANKGLPWYEQKYVIDQGITVTSRRDFNRIDLAPYAAAIWEHHVGSVMPSFSSVDWTEDGVGNPTKMHAQQDLITNRLKGDYRFGGFIISDWEGIHQIPDPDAPAEGGLTPYKVRVGVKAGTDMFMEPNTAKQFEDLLLAEVRAGRVSQARIDDAVRRILSTKFRLGLFDSPFASPDNVDKVGSARNRAIGREAAAKSQVLLKNSGNALPLKRDAKVYVAGRNADDIGNQAGGWTIQWQGVSGDAIPGTTILEGIREVAPGATVTYSADASAPTAGSDVGVVVVGETPYAEGFGDVGGPECGWCTVPQQEEKSLRLQPGDRAVIDKVCDAITTCVVLVVSGRPQVLTDQLAKMDALVASWLPGSEGAGVADVLFGKRPFTGRLSMSWPRSEAQVPINVGDANYNPLFPFGWGLRTDRGRDRVVAADQNAAAASVWAADGAIRTDPATLSSLGGALATAGANTDLQEAIMSLVRDAAQQAVIAGRAPADWPALIAESDRALLSNDPNEAFRLLVRTLG